MKLRLTLTYTPQEENNMDDKGKYKDSDLFIFQEKLYEFLESFGYYQSSETSQTIGQFPQIEYKRLSQTFHERPKTTLQTLIKRGMNLD